MLTKENCELALEEYDFRSERPLPHEYGLLRKLINEHFELVKENERLSSQLVECQRVCKVYQKQHGYIKLHE